ncbi:MAG: nucleotide exchange factor GrpE [Planctomycetaceae bacterium]|jgi:hypothetical protein|nr:nucleotide exchange factor GrpE [Planctomycetaceae bacterium]
MWNKNTTKTLAGYFYGKTKPPLISRLELPFQQVDATQLANEQESDEVTYDVIDDFSETQIKCEPEPDEEYEPDFNKVREFLRWLNESRGELAVIDDGLPKVGLYQVFEALTSQRQELKLFTKSSRQTQTLMENVITETTKSLEELNSIKVKRNNFKRQITEQFTKTFCSQLMEIDESLLRGFAAADSLIAHLNGLVVRRFDLVAAAYCDGLSLWDRLFHRRALRRFVERNRETIVADFMSAIEQFQKGFSIIAERINRTMDNYELIRIYPAGNEFDPETMNVISTVETDLLPEGRVVEVIRPGYVRNDVVLRFADVTVAKQKTQTNNETAKDTRCFWGRCLSFCLFRK